MSPSGTASSKSAHRFPRVSGDEPGWLKSGWVIEEFSPPARG